MLACILKKQEHSVTLDSFYTDVVRYIKKLHSNGVGIVVREVSCY